jgi:hypothetical protein
MPNPHPVHKSYMALPFGKPYCARYKLVFRLLAVFLLFCFRSIYSSLAGTAIWLAVLLAGPGIFGRDRVPLRFLVVWLRTYCNDVLGLTGRKRCKQVIKGTGVQDDIFFNKRVLAIWSASVS